MAQIRKNIVRFLEKPWITRISGITLFVFGSYLTAQKLFGFSLSEWIRQEANISIPKDGFFYKFAFILFGISVVRQAILLFLPDVQRELEVEFTEDSSPVRCIQVNNQEIEGYLNRFDDPSIVRSEFASFHKYVEGIQVVASVLGPAIREYDKSHRLKNKHIFVSIYESAYLESLDEQDNSKLTYVAHYPPNRDDADTKTIDCEGDHSNFACSNAFRSDKKVLILDARKGGAYFIGAVKRRKKIRHYIGVPISFRGRCYGVINIEFHDTVVFSSEDDMKDFYVQCISPFRRLVEYQMLKKLFFKILYGKWIRTDT